MNRDQPPGGPPTPGWSLILPVQRGERAKSRLRVPHGVDRPALARAIATDSLAAVRACPAVALRVVVTSDPLIGPLGRRSGDEVIDDPGVGLAAAIQAGVSHAAGRRPLAPVAVLLADVPAAGPDDLDAALSACARLRSAVLPDLDGDGTVLLSASSSRLLRPAFGPGSAQRHRRLGAQVLDLDLPRLRRDVDTAEDLRHAQALGLGPATTAVLLSSLARMQATVHDFDDLTGAGSVLLDDGRRLPFDPEVFAASGLRRLRVGQRLTIDVRSTETSSTSVKPEPVRAGPPITGPPITGLVITGVGIIGI